MSVEVVSYSSFDKSTFLKLRLRNPTKQIAYVWWILTFLLATLAGVLSLIDLFKGAINPSFELYLVIASWPVSCFLLACAICGERWIPIETESQDGLTEPLLNGGINGSDVVGHAVMKDSEETPFATAGYFNRMIFKWLDPLLAVGYKRPLQQKDVPHLNTTLQAKTACDAFLDAWEAQKQNNPSKPQSIFWALVTVYWRPLARNGLCAFGKCLALALGPLILRYFINFESGERLFAYEGYTLVAALFLSKILESLLQRHWYAGARMVGLQLRSGLIASIYQKQLR